MAEERRVATIEIAGELVLEALRALAEGVTLSDGSVVKMKDNPIPAGAQAWRIGSTDNLRTLVLALTDESFASTEPGCAFPNLLIKVTQQSPPKMAVATNESGCGMTNEELLADLEGAKRTLAKQAARAVAVSPDMPPLGPTFFPADDAINAVRAGKALILSERYLDAMIGALRGLGVTTG